MVLKGPRVLILMDNVEFCRDPVMSLPETVAQQVRDFETRGFE